MRRVVFAMLALLFILHEMPARAGSLGSALQNTHELPPIEPFVNGPFPSCMGSFTLTVSAGPYHVGDPIDMTLDITYNESLCPLASTEWIFYAEKYPIATPPVHIVVDVEVAPESEPLTRQFHPTEAGIYKLYGLFRHYWGFPYCCNQIYTFNTVIEVLPALTDHRLQPSDLTYLGAFMIPLIHGDPDPTGLSGSGSSLCYSSEGDPGNSDAYPGTLYVDGRAGASVARISIPVPKIGPQNTLNTAGVIDPVNDLALVYYEAMFGSRPFTGDYFWLPAIAPQTEPHLYGSVWIYYEGNDQDTFWSNSETYDDLSHLWHIGPHPAPTDQHSMYFSRKNCDYIFRIPQQWADAYTGGNYLAIGQGQREGGHFEMTVPCPNCPGGGTEVDQFHFSDAGRKGGNMGPGFVAIDPSDVSANPADGFEVPAVICAGYNNDHPVHLTSDPNAEEFSDKDEWRDGAWLSDQPYSQTGINTGKQAVAFLVRKCLYDSRYSHGGDVDHCYCMEDQSDACGYHIADGYICGHLGEQGCPCNSAYLWFFDPNDYAKVTQGIWQSWLPQPYAVMPIDGYIYSDASQCDPFNGNERGILMGGVTYDDVHKLLFVAEHGKSGCCDRPGIVHIFHVGGAYP